MSDMGWYIIAAAWLLDYLIGDPRWLPHPIVGMGKAIYFCEPFFRKITRSLVVNGLFFSLFLIGAAWALAYGLVQATALIHPFVSDITQAVLLFFCFSSKSLEKAAMAVFDALAENDIQKARQRIAMIVGRQTDQLDETAIARAGIETVGENFVDGFLSPLFFALIGGAPLAIAYKMINTLDSMVGYKNDAYLLFGRASARIDDAANFIPARLSVAVISLSCLFFSRHAAKRAWNTAVRQGRMHKSPNAGFPEAAFAGALRTRLGGPNVYHGTVVEKPFLGGQFADPQKEKIKQACDLMTASSFTAVVLSCMMLFIIQLIS